MNVEDIGVSDRASALRSAFDRSFSDAPHVEASASEDFLTVTIGGDPYALRLSGLAGLHADKAITSLPSPVGALLGIAGFRGRILPVYDLGMLLGKPKTEAPRWVVVTVDSRVALAFESFDGFLTARMEAVVPDVGEGRGFHIRELLQGTNVRPIIHLPSVLETLADGGGSSAQS